MERPTVSPDQAITAALSRVQALARGCRAAPQLLTYMAATLNLIADTMNSAGSTDLDYAMTVDPGEQARDQSLIPPFTILRSVEGLISGTVSFSRFYVGDHSAHGGAIALFFDDVLGRIASQVGTTVAHTASLAVDFRSPLPIGVEVEFAARVERVEGRKRFVSAAITCGPETIAEARGLWIGERISSP